MGKHWWFKSWRMDDFLPNSPMLQPSKVSLHTVVLHDLIDKAIPLSIPSGSIDSMIKFLFFDNNIIYIINTCSDS